MYFLSVGCWTEKDREGGEKSCAMAHAVNLGWNGGVISATISFFFPPPTQPDNLAFAHLAMTGLAEYEETTLPSLHGGTLSGDKGCLQASLPPKSTTVGTSL